MKKAVFIDSSAWISYVIPTDSNYLVAASVFKSIAIKRRLYTSLFIVDETITKIRRSLDQVQADRLYKQFNKLEKASILTILTVDKKIVDQAMRLLEKHPTPNTFSLTDATNIILCKKYKIPTLFSFDSDFGKVKIPYLALLP